MELADQPVSETLDRAFQAYVAGNISFTGLCKLMREDD